MNTHCQPIACAAIGSSRIDAIVSRKPAQVWMRQRGADVVARAVLGDQRRELRGVGDDRDAPDDREEIEQRRRRVEDRSRPRAQHTPLTIIAQLATRALPIRSANKPAAADPIAPLPIVANATADPAGELGVAPPLNAEARRGERRDPGPDRVELPHVPEIAERREARAAIGEDAADGAPDRSARCSRRTVRRRPQVTTIAPPSSASADADSISVRHGIVADAEASRCGNADPIVSAPISTPSAAPRRCSNQPAAIFIPGG